MITVRLSLAALVLAATVIEQARYALARYTRTWGWLEVLSTAIACGAVAAALVGSLAAGAVLACMVALTRIVVRYLVDPQPPTLWKGLITVFYPYAVILVWWAVFHPQLAAWALHAAAFLHHRLTAGTTPLEPGDLLRVLLVATAYLFVWGSGTVVTRAALGLDDHVARMPAAAGRGLPTVLAAEREAAATVLVEDERLDRWGRLIGNLERFLVLTLTLYGQFASIGLVLAAKSVVRFEMAREKAEYYLVGTLTSMGLAMTLGLLVASLTR